MTPTPEMEAFAREVAMKHFGTCNGLMIRIMSVAIMEASEKAARVAESAFDDRRYLRCRHHGKMDWTYGYGDATRAVAAAIRNGEHLR